MDESLVSIEEIRAAAHRIAAIAIRTPLLRAAFPPLSGHGTGKEIYLKAESLQPIGAFKIRGAANKILQLTPEQIRRGVITYSSGNHAQGVAYAAREVGAKAVIVMPSNAPAIKRAATLAMGAEVVDVGVASSERLAKSDELVREHGYVVIPPYDDREIIAGQATCGLEIVEQLPRVDLVLAPVSGGGLLSGVATYAMVDYCMGSTLWAQTTKDERIATISISINYVQTATEGEIVCRTVLDRRNRTVGIMKSEVRHEDGKLLVTAVGIYSIRVPRELRT